MRQLYFAQLDLGLHKKNVKAPSQEGKPVTVFDFQRRIAAKYSPHLPPIEGDRFLCTFTHIFGGGYSAGYYSYKWAEVMSADAFGKFEEAGLDNEDEIRKVGMEFRNTFLAMGGGAHPKEVFFKFRGREPNPDCLLRHSGLLNH